MKTAVTIMGVVVLALSLFTVRLYLMVQEDQELLYGTCRMVVSHDKFIDEQIKFNDSVVKYTKKLADDASALEQYRWQAEYNKSVAEMWLNADRPVIEVR